MSLLKQVLNEMPQEFTSNQFARMAIERGYPNSRIGDGAIAVFLKLNAERGETNRTWHKRQTKQSELTQIDKAVILLKQNGYKVFKAVTEYKEL